jgi:hypothetical protein
MANQTITQLPTAGPITGTELVPIVQNGGTYKTTTAAISASPSQTYQYLTAVQTPQLPNSRFLSSGAGIGFTDGGAQSFYQITLNGVSGTLESMASGFAVKIGGTMTPRSITYSGAGIDVIDGDGQSGNPVIALTGTVASLANSGGTGFLALPGNGTVSGRTLTGTANQIGITNPNGIAGSPVFSIADNPILPGTEGVTVPVGTTAERPASANNGELRYNTSTGTFEGYANNAWGSITTGTGVTSVDTGTGLTGGPITSTGTISIANTTVTAGSYTSANITVNAQGQITAASNGAPDGITSVAGTANEITATTVGSAVTVSLPSALTFTGKTITGGTYASPAITGTVKLTGTGASAYTPFIQTFSSSVTNFNGYQLNYIQNTNNGSDASVDYVAYNDASDVDSYFIDMGIVSSNYSSVLNTVFPANSGYVYTGGGTSGQASPLLFGTSNAASDITFFTGGTLLANTRATIKGNTGNFLIGTTTDTGYKLNVNGTTYFGGASTFGSTVLLNANPTLALQAATKQYVDAAASTSFVVHEPAVYATTAALPTNTYNNGASGVGATLTAVANGALTVDGGAVTASQRILVKDEVAQANNGVYTVTQAGSGVLPYILTRATDFDTAGTGEIANNAYFFVTAGATQAGDSFVLSQTAAITVGTTALPFTLFADQAVYTGGTNITVAGQIISVSGTIAATLGGTGTSTVTTGDLLYGSGTNTWSKLPLGVAYKSLIVNASGTQVEWNAVPLNQTTAVSGSLNVANGGTGVNTLTGLAYGNGTSAFTAATGAEVVAVIGSTAVTNATNVATTATATNTNFFIPFVAASTTGNQALGVDAGITYNPSTNALTASINGGTF